MQKFCKCYKSKIHSLSFSWNHSLINRKLLVAFLSRKNLSFPKGHLNWVPTASQIHNREFYSSLSLFYHKVSLQDMINVYFTEHSQVSATERWKIKFSLAKGIWHSFIFTIRNYLIKCKTNWIKLISKQC